ncbi:hypothetical protein GUJ93_ZPchr0007g3698 [Zizania palustris]|uniref:Uncharacterized protein n=1 Tax=Zizania palustris TaxID=103762 RepID=A0A8J5TCV4_ZIZPA|nr:hypothetical protein GUJ93_ZPchr0007g3698 [Zizania palustris]
MSWRRRLLRPAGGWGSAIVESSRIQSMARGGGGKPGRRAEAAGRRGGGRKPGRRAEAMTALSSACHVGLHGVRRRRECAEAAEAAGSRGGALRRREGMEAAATG